MMPNDFSSAWTDAGLVLANHIWQSTLFAAVIWLLALLLRQNQARARYWLWLAASLKFLFPFSWLVALGSWLASSRHVAETKAAFYLVIEQVSRPFSQEPLPQLPAIIPRATAPAYNQWLFLLLFLVWLCGCVVVLTRWCVRWRQISAIARKAVLLREGREVEALHRLQSKLGMKQRVEIRLSHSSLEPGIFGVLRPVLLWPERISERLGEEHLESVLAHELGHVCRRDNLAASLHMLVEAIFWFHPLVWWLGARLVEEREHACDEEVLALGSRRHAYAESILKTCEFCVEAPLACVSGVTGANLKGRIARIMTQRHVEKLGAGKKFLLAVAGTAAVAGPVVFGLLHAPQLRATSTRRTMIWAQSPQTAAAPARAFDVASIKRNTSGSDFAKLLFTPAGMSVENQPLHILIRSAYGVQDTQIIGEPGWLNSEKYDVEAKIDPAFVGHYEPSDRRLALQQLLIERCKLNLHRETRELPVYELVVAKDGPKIKPSKQGDTYTDGFKRNDGTPQGPGIWMRGRGNVTSQGMALPQLLSILSRYVDRPIVDKTGLKGNYDYALHWTPDDPAALKGADGGQPAALPESSEPSLFVAIQEQLGLKLESKKDPVEVLVIDHVEKPSEN